MTGVDAARRARNTWSFTHGKGTPVESSEQQANEDKQTDERDELDDLDVKQQQAEDVKGGARKMPKIEL